MKNNRLKSSLLLVISCIIYTGCSLPEPCDSDELYSKDGNCIKCHDMDGYHVNADSRCVEDTVTECGDGRVNCSSGEGVVQAECVKGKCLVLKCDETNGYKSEIDHCKLAIPADDTDCGLNHYNCRKEGVKTVACINNSAQYQCNVTECDSNYHLAENGNPDEMSWMPMACIEDTDDACGISQENCNAKTGAKQVVCLNGKCQILSCDAARGYIPDNSSAEMQCVYSYDNTDYDSALNYEDACPNNPSKWDKKVWGEDSENQGGCDVMDTDLDNTDDSMDVCPTRKDIQTVAQLKSKGLCTDTTCPKPSDIATATAEEKAAWCGIMDNSGDIPAYHIYHVDDFEILRPKLIEIYNYHLCTDEKEFCIDQYHKTSCLNGYLRTYYCDCSQDPNDTNKIICKSSTPESISTEIEITLENDIELNLNSVDSYKVWHPLTLFAAHLDGKSHKITFKLNHINESDASGRNFLNALIEEATLSKIENLTLDMDVKAYGHSLLVNKLYSSELDHITIENALLEYKAADAQGVGLLAGRAENKQLKTGKISNITLNNSAVIAENATNVGGMVGYSTGFDFSGEFKSTLREVSGYQNVGGMIGNITKFNFNSTFINRADLVSGSVIVGGFAGYMDSNSSSLKRPSDAATDKDFYWAYNGIKTIKGNDMVGGFIGYGYTHQGKARFDRCVYNRIGDVYGNTRVSGFIGQANGYSINISYLYNRVNHIYGNASVGGTSGIDSTFYGQSAYNVYNYIDTIEPLDSKTPGTVAGGFCPYLNSSVGDSSVYNVFNHIGFMGRYEQNAAGLIAFHTRDNSPSENITIHHVHSEINFANNTNPSQTGLIFIGNKMAKIHCVSSYANGISSNQSGFIGSNIETYDSCKNRHRMRNTIIMASESADNLSCQTIVSASDSHQFGFINTFYYKPDTVSSAYKNNAEICSFADYIALGDFSELGTFTDATAQVAYMNANNYHEYNDPEICDSWVVRTFKPEDSTTEISLPAVFDEKTFIENYLPANKYGDEIETWFNQ